MHEKGICFFGESLFDLKMVYFYLRFGLFELDPSSEYTRKCAEIKDY